MDFGKFGGKKKFEKVTFFLVFGLKKITKKYIYMEKNWVKKLLEISDNFPRKIVRKVWKKFPKEFPTSSNLAPLR